MYRTTRSPDDAAAANYAKTETRYAVLLKGRLRVERDNLLIRIRDISAGGMMAIVPREYLPGTPVTVSIRDSIDMTGVIAWSRGEKTGIAFDLPIDPLDVLAGGTGVSPVIPAVAAVAAQPAA